MLLEFSRTDSKYDVACRCFTAGLREFLFFFLIYCLAFKKRKVDPGE